VAAFDIITFDASAAAKACRELFGTYTIFDKKGYVCGEDGRTNPHALVYQHHHEGLAQHIARDLGMNIERSFDVVTGCASFNYGLALADALIKNEPQYIIVAAIDKMLDVTNPKDRSTVILFGELAGAALLGPSDKPGFLGHALHTDGTKRETISMRQLNGTGPYFWQDGAAVYKWAIKKIIEHAETAAMASEGRIVFVPHQANPRMLQQAIRNKVFAHISDVILTGEKFGNSSTASIAHALDVGFETGRIKPGDYVAISDLAQDYLMELTCTGQCKN
jgi:3-oxoacyl-[acyl-carrier-protein] synthase-3